MIGLLLKWLASGPLDRVLDTVDRKVSAETDREAIKGQIIKQHYATRGGWMRAGGFWLMLAFALPLAFWHGMVIYDSALGCADCVLANDWTVAALPPPLGPSADGTETGWAGLMVISIFGVIGVTRFK